MMVRVPNVLRSDEVVHCRRVLEQTNWVDGKVTAGTQSAMAKHNLQVPENAPQARELSEIVLRALGRNPLFTTAALPLRVYPPLFNRYDQGMKFDDHVDNAIRFVPNANVRVRTDISATLFLSEPDDYDGGELQIRDTYGVHGVKLPAGDMVLYPGTSLHRVTPITRGSRWASFFWIESMVRDEGRRSLLFDLDQAIGKTRAQLSDDNDAIIALTAVYHNLIRAWSDT